jgi:hypothetical protein
LLSGVGTQIEIASAAERPSKSVVAKRRPGAGSRAAIRAAVSEGTSGT